MDVLQELKKLVNIEIKIKSDEVTNLVFDKAVMPVLNKAVDIIPTEIDNAYLAEKKDELKILAGGLIATEVAKLQEKIDELFKDAE